MKQNIIIFKALGEETRYKIIKALLKGEKCACEIPKLIGRTQSNTSMHLSKMLDWGILNSRKEGKRILYSIKNDNVRNIFKLLE